MTNRPPGVPGPRTCPAVVHRTWERDLDPDEFRGVVLWPELFAMTLRGTCKLCGETLYHRGERRKETA